MRRLTLHIGMPHCGAARIQTVLANNRDALKQAGVLFPDLPGKQNHTRLFMAVTDPDHVDPFRWNRGRAAPDAQQELYNSLRDKLGKEADRTGTQRIILSSWQLATLSTQSEIARLHDFASCLADRVDVVLTMDEQARVLVRHYASQVLDGRIESLDRELGLVKEPSWFNAALAMGSGSDPARNAFREIQSPPFWLDYLNVLSLWSEQFGAEHIRVVPFDQKGIFGTDTASFVQDMFELPCQLTGLEPAQDLHMPSAQWLARARAFNALLQVAQLQGAVIPPRLRKRMMQRVAVPGPEIGAGSLHQISARFEKDNSKLAALFPAASQALVPCPAQPDWTEPGTGNGYRASQYFAAFMPAIERHGQTTPVQPSAIPNPNKLQKELPPKVQDNLAKLLNTRFAPHDGIGDQTWDEGGSPFAAAEPRKLPKGNSGRVIVGCMKNEGPYIVEWVAYHRAIGFDNFLIYTNDCSDHTDDILNRLQELGIVQHRDNSTWKGNSPQQYALNQALKEKVIKNAEWIAHVDVDEFINIKVGNGTLDDLFQHMPDATNIAMTWRLFGHGGVMDFQDSPVLAQFEQAAPRYCPKPHTVWGFKTMFRNIEAYAKISCHRPNKLRDESRNAVAWCNGSGQKMKPDYHDRGWRSDVKSVGYDLVQLNHYALRSMDSFLIKRQRGRALHVDRSVGLNYWIRMDWNDHRDKSIQRNLVRLEGEIEALLKDEELARLHAAAVKWHQAKASELNMTAEFADLRDQASKIKLDSAERVAWALSLDMEE